MVGGPSGLVFYGKRLVEGRGPMNQRARSYFSTRAYYHFLRSYCRSSAMFETIQIKPSTWIGKQTWGRDHNAIINQRLWKRPQIAQRWGKESLRLDSGCPLSQITSGPMAAQPRTDWHVCSLLLEDLSGDGPPNPHSVRHLFSLCPLPRTLFMNTLGTGN